MTERPKVLVYLFGSLGDTIVAIPALRAVREHFQDAEIVLLQNQQPDVSVTASDVLPSDLIDRAISYNSALTGIKKVLTFVQLWVLLRREYFQAAVYLIISERPEKSVYRDRIFFKLCGINKLIGFHPFSKTELYPVNESGHPEITDHEAIRKLKRLELDGININHENVLRQPLLNYSSAELKSTGGWLLEQRTEPASKLAAIAPGCKTAANQWPIENFIEIARKLVSCGFEIIVVGGNGDAETARKMLTDLGKGINAAGKLSVKESAILLSLCDLFIGLDTGTTHLAAAVDTPCFAIYGERNNPGQWFPRGAKHSLVFHQVRCAGCRLFECPVPGHPCMTGISADAVWSNLETFIRKLETGNSGELEMTAV
jgi:heptosyltransferase III